jgi:heat shock protein HslJ
MRKWVPVVRTTVRTTTLLGAAAIVLLGLTACASNSSTTPPAAGSSTAASASASPSSAQGSASGAARSGSSSSGTASSPAAAGIAQFEGITFVATEVTGAYTIVPGSTITLTFERGALSARAGCNSMFGQYTITGGVLSAPQLASTLMACDDALMAQDTWLAAFLASSPTWTYQGGTLTLSNGTDTIAMTKAPSGAEALEATGWKLVGLNSKTATANSTTAVDPTLTAWARFNGTEVAYNTSCNVGGGSAQVADDTITFGALRSTLVFCDGASGQTESAMNAVMQGTTTYKITDDPSGALLTITSVDGASGLQLTADPTVGADAFGSAPATATSTG